MSSRLPGEFPFVAKTEKIERKLTYALRQNQRWHSTYRESVIVSGVDEEEGEIPEELEVVLVNLQRIPVALDGLLIVAI